MAEGGWEGWGEAGEKTQYYWHKLNWRTNARCKKSHLQVVQSQNRAPSSLSLYPSLLGAPACTRPSRCSRGTVNERDSATTRGGAAPGRRPTAGSVGGTCPTPATAAHTRDEAAGEGVGTHSRQPRQ